MHSVTEGETGLMEGGNAQHLAAAHRCYQTTDCIRSPFTKRFSFLSLYLVISSFKKCPSLKKMKAARLHHDPFFFFLLRVPSGAGARV